MTEWCRSNPRADRSEICFVGVIGFLVIEPLNQNPQDSPYACSTLMTLTAGYLPRQSCHLFSDFFVVAKKKTYLIGSRSCYYMAWCNLSSVVVDSLSKSRLSEPFAWRTDGWSDLLVPAEARLRRKRVPGSYTICQRTTRNHKGRQHDTRCERPFAFVVSCMYPSNHVSPQSGTTSNDCISFHWALSPSRNMPVAASYNSSDQREAMETGISAGTTAINASHVVMVCIPRMLLNGLGEQSDKTLPNKCPASTINFTLHQMMVLVYIAPCSVMIYTPSSVQIFKRAR